MQQCNNEFGGYSAKYAPSPERILKVNCENGFVINLLDHESEHQEVMTAPVNVTLSSSLNVQCCCFLKY